MLYINYISIIIKREREREMKSKNRKARLNHQETGAATSQPPSLRQGEQRKAIASHAEDAPCPRLTGPEINCRSSEGVRAGQTSFLLVLTDEWSVCSVLIKMHKGLFRR